MQDYGEYGQSAWDDSELHGLLKRSPDWQDMLDREREKEREKDLTGAALVVSTAIGSGTTVWLLLPAPTGSAQKVLRQMQLSHAKQEPDITSAGVRCVCWCHAA
jgi:hypothetical protein